MRFPELESYEDGRWERYPASVAGPSPGQPISERLVRAILGLLDGQTVMMPSYRGVMVPTRKVQ